MPTANRLVDELADLTAMRDQELLDFSLLKTIDGFLLPDAVEMLKLDARNRAPMVIRYTARQCQVCHDNIALPEDTLTAIEQLGMKSDGEYVARRDDRLLIAYALHATRAERSYLLIRVRQDLSKLNAHLMKGLLQIYRNFCELLHESQCDQLTGLANRKTFDDAIHKIFKLLPLEHPVYSDERRADPAATVWLAMVDIDNFKSINDRFGHLYGDEVLLLLAQLLRATFRDDDLVFRFGGEEFVVVLRCPGKLSCAEVLERLRLALEQRGFPQVGTVTISIGATQMSRETYAITLLDYADQALYHSKKHGKNQITFFEDMLETGRASITPIVAGGITYL